MHETYGSFNKIFGIESLRDGELHTGKRLFEDTIMPICASSAPEWGYRLYQVATKIQFINAMRQIAICCHPNRDPRLFPILHLDLHGDTDKGLEIAQTGEYVGWDLFAILCKEINILCGNKLMVVMATCHGFHAITSATISDVAPYCFLIGSQERLIAGDIETQFAAFYRDLLEHQSDSINAMMHKHLSGSYKLFCAEQILVDAFCKYMGRECSVKRRQERTETILTNLLMELSPEVVDITQMRRMIKESLKPTEDVFLMYQHRFLLSGLPENKGRFTVSYEQIKEAVDSTK